MALTTVECTTNQQINAVTARPGVDPSFLHYALEFDGERIRKLAGNTAVPLVTKSQLLRFPVLLPPIATQRWVGALLRTCDTTTLAVSALVERKHTFKRALMNDLLTGRRRFPEFVRSSNSKRSRVGSIPSDWDITRLSAVTERLTRRNVTNVPRVLTCSGEQGLVHQTDYFTKSVASESREGYFLLHRGDFAYNRSSMKGYPFGAIKRLDRYDTGAVSTLNICFSLLPGTIVSEFLVHFFESGLLNRQLGRIARVGSRAHGLLNVTMDDFYALELPLPTPEEQLAISAVLNRLGDEISILQELRSTQASLKRGLMQRLLSGEIEIPEHLTGATSAAESTDDDS